ncbi:hypothetical protein N7533_009820 [Penicillium manginii]|uniref:uncharacterized protein n=1 Tax=Penicillium manginii TaxID=203109 RepID=UPI002548D0CE|nr:uncharacterized protein N7533_009820 [Penicillium manginii]KAJ5744950.1 hypothetical protein N7533_009820 [Penicillium manginii]
MTSFRLQGFQSLLRGNSRLLRTPQRRWAQVHDVRFLASHHDPKYVQDKYRSKLDQKAKEEGHESVESLKEAYTDKIQNLRPSQLQAPLPPFQAPPSSPAQSETEKAARSVSGSKTPIKPLSSYLELDKFRDLPPKEIEALWRLRHANSATSICAVISLETYQRIAAAARQNPQFVLPVPVQQTVESEVEGQTETQNAAEIHFLQWGFHPPADDFVAPAAGTANTHTSTVIFTNLGAFKMHGTYAQPHTTVTHYLDLADDKGLVLMHGQVMPDSGVSNADATWLISCLQRFYDFEGQANGRKGELVRMFTQGDVENFKIEELLEESEKIH